MYILTQAVYIRCRSFPPTRPFPQVHAVNMSLPRQLLNELSPRALLQLTAELAPYPLLQPRRWSEEIIWTVSQLHAMGADMVLANAPATANGNGNGAGANGANNGSLCAFQWEVRRALAAAAEDVGTRPDGSPASPPSGCPTQQSATCPSGTAVPWAAHAALHRHLLLGLRRVQTRYFVERLQRNQGGSSAPLAPAPRSPPASLLLKPACN